VFPENVKSKYEKIEKFFKPGPTALTFPRDGV
jgi:hypothetical protein